MALIASACHLKRATFCALGAIPSGVLRSTLDDHQFLVLAEDCAEEGADFAEGGVRLDRVDEIRHDILGALGGGAERGHRALPCGIVPLGADAIETRDLARFALRV